MIRQVYNQGLGISSLWSQVFYSQRLAWPGIVLLALMTNQAVWGFNPGQPPQTTPWMRFDLYPPEVVQAGARWKLTHETEWRESGVYYTNIQEGTYRVEFKPVPGWMRPTFTPFLDIRGDRFVRLPAHYLMETNQPATNISANVVIYPLEAVEAGARWRLKGETEWRDPRLVQTNLPVANTEIEFKPVVGWNHPTNFPISLRSGMTFTLIPSYTSIPPRDFPNMQYIAITPLEAVAEGAQWKRTTETEWHDPFTYSTGWTVGIHEVEFKPLPGWLPPGNVKIKIVTEHGYPGAMSINYQQRPQYVVTVNATHGRVAHSNTQGLNSDNSMKFERQQDWRRAEDLFGPSAYRQPGGQSGDRLRLIAVADPGYQFAGWSGDISGVENPAALVLDSDKNITAHFVPVSTNQLTASQAAESFFSPGTLMVHGQVSLPFGTAWNSLAWRPILPDGWTLTEVNGLGRPILQNKSIVFNTFHLKVSNPLFFVSETTNVWDSNPYLPLNPVQFTMVINVPPDQTGTNLIQGEITYAYTEGTNLVRGVAQANPIEWVRQEPPFSFLSLDVAAGPPVLVIHGEPGISCTIQRRDNDLKSSLWTDRAHLRLTNSVQTWVDNTAEPRPRGYIYRAVLLK